MKIYALVYCLIVMMATIGCSKDNDLNLFTVSQDVEFGSQIDSAVLANPTDYPILNKSQYPAVYNYLETMLNDILQSDEILYRDEFNWKITIINSDVVNAFAAPGGYLFFYTGLIKYLDKGSQLAGIMGHEVAHTDRRHSTETMTKEYGFSVLLSILMGEESSQLEQILASLALQGTILAYSRSNENEADKFAVYYTADTRYYNPLGVGGFFEKLLAASEGNGIPEFLSTHPSDENRLENIQNTWNNLKASEPVLTSVDWQDLEAQHSAIKAILP
ncbi:MAG: M48 family metalloprotease [Bacteroidales bacterium]|nr:M48 family metalloprotease [Bacteroidales bacterium]